MYRSEPMGLYQLVVPRESSYEVMNCLGSLDCIEFIDNEPNVPQMQRPFANYIKRCEEMLEKVNFLIKTCSDHGFEQQGQVDYEFVLEYFDKMIQSQHKSPHLFLNEIEGYLNHKHQFVLEQMKTLEQLSDRKRTLLEQQSAMICARKWLGQMFFLSKSSSQLDLDEVTPFKKDQMELGSGGNMFSLQSNRFTHFVGLIDSPDFAMFQKVVFRITKNNFMMVSEKLLTTGQKGRTAFLLIFPGSGSSRLWLKVKRVCDACNVERIPMPKSEGEWDDRYNSYDHDVEETSHLLKLTSDLINSSLPPMLLNSQIPSLVNLRLYLVRECYLYMNLNTMKMQQSLFVARVWIRLRDLGRLQNTLIDLRRLSPHLPCSQLQEYIPDPNDIIYKKPPPTSFKTNQFLQCFQEIVNTYGVPSYREINPAVFTIITFPFLFGVMFGDIAHGICLLLFGIYLSWTKKFSPRSLLKHARQNRIQHGIQKQAQSEDIKEGSSLQIIYDLRYMFILCGFFSVYCGIIYNEYFGFNVDLFGSCYKGQEKICTYILGLDPALAGSLNFTNSVKMKLSIIIGFVQMTLGILAYGANAKFNNDSVSALLVFPSRLIFFFCTVGYLVFVIILKWLKPWPNPGDAPNVISVLVTMWMTGGSTNEQTIWEDRDIQESFQGWLIAISLVCVLFMLIPAIMRDLPHEKVVSLKRKNSQNQVELQIVDGEKVKNDDDFDNIFNNNKRGSAEELCEKEPVKEDQNHVFESSTDVVVHHLIETIEFVLGCVSNTASYLRLWALSLAHSELSGVFYQLTLADGIASGNPASSIAGLPVFMLATLGVLLCMDAMECFLHSLRLHWVEFQNKFFKGDGYLFNSYSFVREMRVYNEKRQLS